MSIAANLESLRARVAAASARAKRDPAAVKLLAVSKLQPASAIEEAYAAGQRDFGENYVQELLEKREQLKHLSGIRWHLIGGLQTNKVRQLSNGELAYFHALDSDRLVREIGKRAKEPWRCFLQVNLDGEQSKGGVAPAAVQSLAAMTLLEGSKIELVGLMCIPEPRKTVEEMRPAFRRLAGLARELSPHGGLELSMGMSADFEIAIEEGSNWVRVGTALFGERR